MLFMDNPIAWLRFGKEIITSYLRIEESNFHVDENGIIDRPTIYIDNREIESCRANIIFILSVLDIKNVRYGKLKEEIRNGKEALRFLSDLRSNV